MNNEKKVAIVVGGGQTLGAFLSEGLADAGYRVVVADLNGENAQKVAADINAKQGEGNAIGVQVDAADEPSVEALAKATDTVFGRADVLVYSAGTAKHRLFGIST
ncbi:Sorbitol-6-phosphate 2-dehydrogenase [Mannheimia haemolytica]|nr:Sorbitol-6-phosphate 2-dehydrogenase [Mannheimia haemolytica]